MSGRNDTDDGGWGWILLIILALVMLYGLATNDGKGTGPIDPGEYDDRDICEIYRC